RGLVHIRRHLLYLAVAVVDPDLDDVDLVRGVLAHGFDRIIDAVDFEGRAALRPAQALAGAEVAGGMRQRLVAPVGRVPALGAAALRRADAERGALLQVAQHAVARGAQMHVGVEHHRHHGLAGQVHAPRIRRHIYAGADRRDLIAVDDDGAVLDDAAVADDDAGALQGGA